MALSLTNIDIGAAPDDGTGDPARTAFGYVNTNPDATFGFETPGKGETAEVITQRTATGFRSVVVW